MFPLIFLSFAVHAALKYVLQILHNYVCFESLWGNVFNILFLLFKGPSGFPGDPGPPGETGPAVSKHSLFIMR